MVWMYKYRRNRKQGLLVTHTTHYMHRDTPPAKPCLAVLPYP